MPKTHSKYNWLVEIVKFLRQIQIAGTSLELQILSYHSNVDKRTRLIVVPNSNNSEDWTIRSQVSKQIVLKKVQRLDGFGESYIDFLRYSPNIREIGCSNCFQRKIESLLRFWGGLAYSN